MSNVTVPDSLSLLVGLSVLWLFLFTNVFCCDMTCAIDWALKTSSLLFVLFVCVGFSVCWCVHALVCLCVGLAFVLVWLCSSVSRWVDLAV